MPILIEVTITSNNNQAIHLRIESKVTLSETTYPLYSLNKCRDNVASDAKEFKHISKLLTEDLIKREVIPHCIL